MRFALLVLSEFIIHCISMETRTHCCGLSLLSNLNCILTKFEFASNRLSFEAN